VAPTHVQLNKTHLLKFALAKHLAAARLCGNLPILDIPDSAVCADWPQCPAMNIIRFTYVFTSKYTSQTHQQTFATEGVLTWQYF